MQSIVKTKKQIFTYYYTLLSDSVYVGDRELYTCEHFLTSEQLPNAGKNYEVFMILSLSFANDLKSRSIKPISA
jgi:hypothetical protein